MQRGHAAIEIARARPRRTPRVIQLLPRHRAVAAKGVVQKSLFHRLGVEARVLSHYIQKVLVQLHGRRGQPECGAELVRLLWGKRVVALPG